MFFSKSIFKNLIVVIFKLKIKGWRIESEDRPSFRDVRMALELLQDEINSGALDSPPGRI